MLRHILAGAAAGAAGTTALNAATYADMAWRGRATSDTPERTVDQLAEAAGTSIPGEGDTRENRRSGLGALSGIVTGVMVGVGYGLLRATGARPPLVVGALLTGLGAMATSDGSMAALGVTDPREWKAPDWATDALPHLAYGLVTAATFEAAASR